LTGPAGALVELRTSNGLKADLLNVADESGAVVAAIDRGCSNAHVGSRFEVHPGE
jgi:hypothetical protein